MSISLIIISLASLSFGKDLRVIGGQEAQPHSIPYQVFLNVSFGDNDNLRPCGGSLISQTHVLTSASCLSNATEVEVILGAHNLQAAENTQVRVKSTSFKKHDNEKQNDLAVIELPNAVELNDNVGLVNLPDINDDANYTLARLSGWGKSNGFLPESPAVLRSIYIPLISNTYCTFFYHSIGPSNICTSGDEGTGACDGDSGDPLVIDGDVLIGVASYFRTFCIKGYPTVFTKVADYLDWIRDSTKQ